MLVQISIIKCKKEKGEKRLWGPYTHRHASMHWRVQC